MLRVYSKTTLQSNKQVFLIDHALTFRYGDLPKLLQSHLQLTDRLSNMLKYWQTKKELPSSSNIYEDPKSNAF